MTATCPDGDMRQTRGCLVSRPGPGRLPPVRRATLPLLVQVLHPDGGLDDVVEADIAAAPDGALTGRSQGLEAEVRARPAAVPPAAGIWAARDVTIAVRCCSHAPVTAGLRIEARLEETDDPGWLIPGLFYGENRTADCARRYPRFAVTSPVVAAPEPVAPEPVAPEPEAPEPEAPEPEAPEPEAPEPEAPEPEAPEPEALESDRWAFRSDRAATPAVFAWDRRGGIALSVGEVSDHGLTGVGFAYVGRRPYLRLHLPYREEPVCYDGSERPGPPERTYFTWQPGEVTITTCRVFFLEPDRHAYAGVLRTLAQPEGPGNRQPEGPGNRQPEGTAKRQPEGTGNRDAAWVGVAEAANLAAHGLYRWHYRPDPPVLLETAAFDRDAFGATADRMAMHVAWVSGAPYAYALLRHGRRRGNAAYVHAATRVLDHIATNLAPAGTFWGQWTQAQGWRPGWSPKADRLHSRTLADATLFQLRALAAEREHGVAHPGWEAAVRSNLDVAQRAQRCDGAMGSAYDPGSGEVLDWRGSAGLAWVAPLAEASRVLSQPGLLDTARRAGAYYSSFVQAEYLCGAPEDVDTAPTSEDGYLALMSYLSLYRETGEGAWLDLAQRAADWMLTFRYTYDVSFSPRTLLGRYGFRTRGADQASPANQHLHAFGLICLPELAELARVLSDPYYLERARENLACFRQFIAREDGDFDAWKGMATERYYQTRCFQAKGMILTLSHAWSVGVLLYACEMALAIPELRSPELRRAT